jgi:hypothetical protein
MNKEKFQKIQEKFNNSSIDLEDIVHDEVDFINITKESIKNINRWVKFHSDIYKMEKVILYHGTSSKNDIEKEGIKKTTLKTKKSLQSAVGFVCLSLYPNMAKTFGDLAYPYDDIRVYAVEVLVKDLLADHDQLFNKRMWDDENSKNIGKTIGDSLVYGSGCRVKSKIEPYQVRDVTELLFPVIKDSKVLSKDIGKIKDKYYPKEIVKNSTSTRKK